ncbi:GNAT family N-acetyltransferase [Pelagovum pacificum]|uniref:GNAT family N-acetyltransferase n=1 Tax=Pelagovum pacificum TaxID=2588711 RepID=A0A5C5GF99_9RHOB|nr:GNAT family N-acetyltransferase [Pelagovum pacificum]QQA43431.1 GNAT family N-acetyltransferase [Pelagovum pacificum]TNY33432.1 GNAT family N-acetyltransferase [Pelagovum pacificum]
MTGVSCHIPTIETDTLRLRAPEDRDLEAYVTYGLSERSRTVGGPFERGESFHRLCAIAGHWQIRGYGRWIVADKITDEPLGVVGPYKPEAWPEPEIAWTVFAEAEGRGVAAEAALAARAFVYDTLGWSTVMSGIDPANVRSVRLAQRLGCTLEGTFETDAYGTLGIWRHPAPDAPQQEIA